jgi:hypothetical protein
MNSINHEFFVMIRAVMNTPSHFARRFARLIPSLALMALSSCGDYTSTTPVSSSQEMTQLKGYSRLSGRPALRTPAAIGIFTTSRTEVLDFGTAAQDLTKSGQIRSMQSINALVSSSDYYQLGDVLAKRAQLLNDVKFLGLDVILVCDQMSDGGTSDTLVKAATLGMLDIGLPKQNTQLTVLCMDARTGYIYGTMGQQEDGVTPRLGIFDSTVFGGTRSNRLVNTTRRDAVKQFPAFWNEVMRKYGK